MYRDIVKANDALIQLEENQFKCDFFTLKAFLDYYTSKGDIVNVINTFQEFKHNGIGYLNRHVMEAIIKLATNADVFDHRTLLQFFHSDESEFKRAILNAIPVLVERNHATLVPEIIGAINHNTGDSVNKLFTEMVRRHYDAEVYQRIWAKLDSMGFSIRSDVNAYKPALKGRSVELIKVILLEINLSPTHHLQDSYFEHLLMLSASDGVNELTKAINLMSGTYNVRPRLMFICKHIMPLLRKEMSHVDAVNVLCSTQIRSVDAVVAGIIAALTENDMSTAYYIASRNNVYLANDCIVEPLQRAYAKTKDVDRFIKFVCLIVQRISNEYGFLLSANKDQATKTHFLDQRRQFVARIVETTMLAQRSNIAENVNLLNGFLREDLAITSKQAENIRRKLKITAQSPIDQLLAMLSTINIDR